MFLTAVGIVWTGALIYSMSLMKAASDADDRSEEQRMSNRKIRREFRVIHNRCEHARGRHISECPIYHSTDDMYMMWRSDV